MPQWKFTVSPNSEDKEKECWQTRSIPRGAALEQEYIKTLGVWPLFQLRIFCTLFPRPQPWCWKLLTCNELEYGDSLLPLVQPVFKGPRFQDGLSFDPFFSFYFTCIYFYFIYIIQLLYNLQKGQKPDSSFSARPKVSCTNENSTVTYKKSLDILYKSQCLAHNVFKAIYECITTGESPVFKVTTQALQMRPP